METSFQESNERKGNLAASDKREIETRRDAVRTLADELAQIERTLDRINKSFM